MAAKNTRKLDLKTLQDDVEALDALAAIADYNPSNKDYSQANAQNIVTETKASEAKAVQDDAQAKASRDAMVKKQWERHDFVLNMRKQIAAQYGADADELQAVGLKKKSEYKTPKPKKDKS